MKSTFSVLFAIVLAAEAHHYSLPETNQEWIFSYPQTKTIVEPGRHTESSYDITVTHPAVQTVHPVHVYSPPAAVPAETYGPPQHVYEVHHQEAHPVKFGYSYSIPETVHHAVYPAPAPVYGVPHVNSWAPTPVYGLPHVNSWAPATVVKPISPPVVPHETYGLPF